MADMVKIAVVEKNVYEKNKVLYRDDIITLAFHKGKFLTPIEFEELFNNGNAKDIKIQLAQLTDKCDEWCPHCETEVELDTDFKMQICPNCGKPIAPCNLCGGICVKPCPLGCR